MTSGERFLASIPKPAEPMEFTGERFTPGTLGEIEHEHHHRYLFALQLCAGRDVLDVASGEGYGSALLSTVARSVVGVDVVPDVVEHARRSYAQENLSYRVGDCTALPLEDGSVDVVVSFETLEHISEQSRFLAEVKRVLRPAGTLLLSSPVRGVYSPGNPNPFHVRELTRAELEALVGAVFRHAVYLAQTPVVGSTLVPDDPCPPGVLATQIFWRREDGSYEATAGGALAPYLVVVASDDPLPAVRAGTLHDHPYVERLQGEAAEKRAAIARASVLAARASVLAARAAAAEDEGRRLAAELEASWRVLDAALEGARPRGLARVWDSIHRRLVVRRIRKSGLFDADHYRRTYPDVPSDGDPIRHFVKHGAVHGRNPHEMFDTRYYVRENPDVSRRGMNPLLHFALVGAAEGRRPHPKYTASEYLDAARGHAGTP